MSNFIPGAAHEAGIQDLGAVWGNLGNEAVGVSSEFRLKATNAGKVGGLREAYDKNVTGRIDGHRVGLVWRVSAQVGSPQQVSRGIELSHKRIRARNYLVVFVRSAAGSRGVPFRLKHSWRCG